MGRSIYAKQLLQYILIILLISGGIGLLFFNTAKGHLEREVGRKLQYIARIGAKSTPIERLQLIRLGDDQTRMVRREKEKLQEIQAATGVARIGLFRPDGFSLLDIDDRLIGSRVDLPHLTGVMRDQLAAGGSVNTTGYLAAGDEFFISAYAPVTDAHGKLAAIVGVDAGAGELALISQMRSRLYLITFLCIAGACLLALLFVRSITSPVRQMALTAERLGAGNYQARASAWPGNIRELQNVIERAAILSETDEIGDDALPVSLDSGRQTNLSMPEGDVDFDREMDDYERRLILHAFEKSDKVKARTAKMLGIDRNRLRYKLKKYGIED